MTVAIIILALIYHFYKTSYSTYFLTLKNAVVEWQKIETLLLIKGRSIQDIDNYKIAFNFFVENPTLYDGATIVKDLEDLPRLDLDAMLHDFECIVFAKKNYKEWCKSAWRYFENMRKNGKGNQITRLIGIVIIGAFWLPYSKIKQL